jgi:hypothetical protein
MSLNELGNCACQQGDWQAAAGWYKHAVADKRQGDPHGRVDHRELGSA